MSLNQSSYHCPKCGSFGVHCDSDMREMPTADGMITHVNMGATYSCVGCDEQLYKDDIKGTFHNRDEMRQLEKERVERKRHDTFYAGQALF